MESTSKVFEIAFGSDHHKQKGWRLGAPHSLKTDTRHNGDPMCSIVNDDEHSQQWFLKEAENGLYHIVLDHEDGKHHEWRLTCFQNKHGARDDHSNWVGLYKDHLQGGQLWEIKTDEKTGLSHILVADGLKKGWKLTSLRETDDDKRDDKSSYICAHEKDKDGQLWKVYNFIDPNRGYEISAAHCKNHGWKMCYRPSEEADSTLEQKRVWFEKGTDMNQKWHFQRVKPHEYKIVVFDNHHQHKGWKLTRSKDNWVHLTEKDGDGQVWTIERHNDKSYSFVQFDYTDSDIPGEKNVTCWRMQNLEDYTRTDNSIYVSMEKDVKNDRWDLKMF